MFEGVIATLINAASLKIEEKANVSGDLDNIDELCAVFFTEFNVVA